MVRDAGLRIRRGNLLLGLVGHRDCRAVVERYGLVCELPDVVLRLHLGVCVGVCGWRQGKVRVFGAGQDGQFGSGRDDRRLIHIEAFERFQIRQFRGVFVCAFNPPGW
ncbi:hypothetical protein SDC9_169999 [bioreactor metagenome]|uniref:Uncharacterized protein n=1 Tax=bioreactor metagenome TaxID=1076179 RepID=A0A645G924_9ZZZZ